MSCLDLSISVVSPCELAIKPTDAPILEVAANAAPEVAVRPVGQPSLVVMPGEQPSLAVAQVDRLELSIGEVCSVSSGTIVVLATAEGPLRLSNGGYLLLDPALNPPEN